MIPREAAFPARLLLMLTILTVFCAGTTSAQMRRLYVDTTQPTSDFCKLSFYSPSQGFMAFTGWIGFTADSGRTFTKKPITYTNVDFNGYSVNLTFGFDIMGIRAFDKNTLIVYGNYGTVPAILYSSDGGNTFKLVLQSQADPNQISLTNGIADMDFAPNTNTGFAVDEDRILESTDKGITWSVIYTRLKTYYNYVQALDASHVFAAATYYDAASQLQKTVNGGNTWQTIPLPAPTERARLTAVFFVNTSTGWIVMTDNGTSYFYETTNGGSGWTLLNNVEANPFPASHMKFIDTATGYAVNGGNTVYKTSSGGRVWEPLQRDNNIQATAYSTYNDVQILNNNQLWAGWAGVPMLEISTNAGGIPLPRSYPYIDTAGLSKTGKVNLVNYSATGYTYQWLLNDVPISTDYNTSYVHDTSRVLDVVTLIVSNGIHSDTTTTQARFNLPLPPLPVPTITYFSPTSGATGETIAIIGTNFYENETVPTVTIGGVPVTTVYVYSSTLLNVIVGAGASGNIVVITPGGSDTAGPFTYIPPPGITSFSPASATLGDVVTIKGIHFTGATSVSFGDTAVRSFTVVSDSVIKATVWLGASGAVKVTRPSGTGQASGFTYIAPPAPAINTLSTFSGTPGTPVKISGTHFYGTTSVTIGGTQVHSFVVVSDTEIDVVVGFSVSGDVKVTTLFGSGSIGGFTILPPPAIATLSPQSGSIGTVVTITGAYFSPVAAQNIVYFGSVKAVVTSATAAQLKVKVPYGANYKPVSVTVKNLTGYSLQPFLVTSLDSVRTLTDSSFETKKDFPSDGYQEGNIAVADFDGDGKPDLANSIGTGKNISVLRNLCSPGTISFDNLINLTTEYFPKHVTACDLDGDGKPDLLAASQYLSILKNTSSGAGHISFANAVYASQVLHPEDIVTGDLNGDGKPDMVVLNGNNHSIDVFGNISTTDTIAFAAPVSVSFGENNLSGGVAIGDIDGDGKPDITVVQSYSGIVVLRNTGVNRSFSFAPSTAFPVDPGFGSGSLPGNVSIGDLDGDGKPDLAIGLAYNNAFTILRNTSTAGTVSFDAHVDFDPGSNFTGTISIEDLDGDGKPDLTLNSPDKDGVFVYKNISIPGGIFFGTKLHYATTPDPISAITGDLDLDGKPDIITNNNYFTFAVSVLRNRSKASAMPSIADTNYKIQVVNNTCQNKNDGKIIVTFAQALVYTVTITGTGFADSDHVAGYHYERDSLPAGVYEVCFTVESYPAYRQCFTVSISQPKDLSLYFTVQESIHPGALIDVTLGGSDVYTVDYNGTTFQTSASRLSVPLQAGLNTLTVNTPLACQGSITKTFFVPTDSTGIKLIPNPATSIANLYVPGTDAKVEIEVLGTDGKIVEKQRTYTVGADRAVHLNVSRYANGLYMVYVQSTKGKAFVKLVKAN